MPRKLSPETKAKNCERSLLWQQQNRERKNQLNRESRARKKQETEQLKKEIESLKQALATQ